MKKTKKTKKPRKYLENVVFWFFHVRTQEKTLKKLKSEVPGSLLYGPAHVVGATRRNAMQGVCDVIYMWNVTREGKLQERSNMALQIVRLR